MLIKTYTGAFVGMKSYIVSVEVNISSKGLPSFDIVGLPDRSIIESRHRIKTAIKNSGMEFPNKKITVNLAPANLRKDGTFYDLPIALGIICASLSLQTPVTGLFFGELSLDGSIISSKNSSLFTYCALDWGYKEVFISSKCSINESFAANLNIFGVSNLSELLRILKGIQQPNRIKFSNLPQIKSNFSGPKFEDILGQYEAKRALEICIAGGHNLLMVGPPGVGKSMLAQSVKTILPPLSKSESVEVTKILSLDTSSEASLGLVSERPFRSPHHTISYSGMLGGGKSIRPGEVSLAHTGVLFVDEFNEFSRIVLESLRQPLESGEVTVTRSTGYITFPAKFILIASSNPCPCGYYNSKDNTCVCTTYQVHKYQAKISGPLMDRFDIRLYLRTLSAEFYKKSLLKVDTSDIVLKRVISAREVQRVRFLTLNIKTNSEMQNKDIQSFCLKDSNLNRFLTSILENYRLSTRGYFKLLKVARTIADLEGSNLIHENHVSEALQYRMRLIT